MPGFHIPTIPPIKTRAPATDKLILHFLDNGWLGQARPPGQLVKILVNSDGHIIYRSNNPRTILLLQTILKPSFGWNIFLSIRQYKSGCLWLLDCMMSENVVLTSSCLKDRLKLIPRSFISPDVKLAQPLQTLGACQSALAAGHDILFRHLTMPGWRAEGMVILTGPGA